MSDSQNGWGDYTPTPDGGTERVYREQGVVRERVHDSGDRREHTVTHYGRDGRPDHQVQTTRERPGGAGTEVTRTFRPDGTVATETQRRVEADRGAERRSAGHREQAPTPTEARGRR